MSESAIGWALVYTCTDSLRNLIPQSAKIFYAEITTNKF